MYVLKNVESNIFKDERPKCVPRHIVPGTS